MYFPPQLPDMTTPLGSAKWADGSQGLNMCAGDVLDLHVGAGGNQGLHDVPYLPECDLADEDEVF